ncbi:MAG: hypothetical protein ACK4R3_13075, partial [Aliihoeflea sp.]
TILIATAAILASGSAFAMQQGPVNVGNYDASVQSQYAYNTEYMGPFTFGTRDTMTTASIAEEAEMVTPETRSEMIFEDKSGR